MGCSDALFSVNSVVDFLVKNGCTVNLATLDISKAFDIISHYALFLKLINRGFQGKLFYSLNCGTINVT